MTAYINHLFDEGLSANAAQRRQRIKAAWEALVPEYSRHGDTHLPHAVRAIKGFLRLAPPQVGHPLPEACLFAICGALLHAQHRLVALGIALQFSTYMRPGVLFKLRAVDVLAPTVSRHVALKPRAAAAESLWTL
eukprot:5731547-Amphidinium_carterae.1